MYINILSVETTQRQLTLVHDIHTVRIFAQLVTGLQLI